MIHLLALDRTRYRAALAAVAALLLFVPIPLVRALAVFIIVGILPGVAIVPRGGVAMDVSLGLGTAVAPVVSGAFALLALAAGVHMNGSAWIAAAGSLGLFVTFGGFFSGCTAEDVRARRGLLCLLAFAAVMALALPLGDGWWRTREDSWFHAAVADKLVRDGLPITDPYFAGLRLQYMYFYHVIIATCATLARIDYFHAMILVNAVALTSSAFAFHALAGLFTRRVGPRVLATAVWLFGMNGWFYLFYPVRAARGLVGETRGLELLREFFPWTPPGHATAMQLIAVEGNQFMLLDKFMVGTAFSLTFSLTAALLLLLAHARRGWWSGRHDLAFVLCAAGAMALHLVTGVTVTVVTALVLALLLVMRAQTASGGPSYARLAVWLGVAVGITLPYVRSVVGDGDAGGATLGIAVQPGNAIGLASAVLPALALAAVFFRRAGARRDTDETLGARPFAELSVSATGLLLVWTFAMLVVALCVDLTTNNETKFAFLVHLPLAAFAAGGMDRIWDRPRARRWTVVAVISATLPLHVLYYMHAVRDANTLTFGDQERAVYGWIRDKSPRDAIFVEEQDLVSVPVMASRDLYWGTEGYARNWGYPVEEVNARRAVRDAVFSPAGPTEADLTRLRALGRPVFVIFRSPPDDMIDSYERFVHDRRFHGRFATTEISVWEVR